MASTGPAEVSSGPLSLQVAQQLKDLIFKEQRFAPGSKLPDERSLAQEMGVSRASLREATKTLAANGILVIRRGVGTFVSETPGRQPDPLGFALVEDKRQLLHDWYRVRLILESEAMELVAENATNEEIQGLEALMEQQFDIYGQKIGQSMEEESRAFVELDRGFHVALASLTHSSVMERILPALLDWVYFELVVGLYTRVPDRLRKNAEDNHRLVLSFLKRRDAKGAYLAMRYHMLCAINDLED